MSQAFPHEPVMATEVTDLLGRVPDGLVLDATLGGAGHARRLLEAHPGITLLGIDRDPMAVAAATGELAVFGRRAIIRRARFDALGDVVRQVQDELGTPDDRAGLTGVLFDLGVSSPQLDVAERGFSYRRDAPLDMRMDPTVGRTGADVVNESDEDTLVELFADNGETRFARRIARAIIAARPITTTGQLADVVREAIPAATRRTGGHPARRVFQAIRIAVNEELDQLQTGLDAALGLLRPGGRCVVISYHSGEDRLVKATFTQRRPPTTASARRACRASAAPIPSSAWSAGARASPPTTEIARNRRSEAARLRVVERLPSAHRHVQQRRGGLMAPPPAAPATARRATAAPQPRPSTRRPALRVFEPEPRRSSRRGLSRRGHVWIGRRPGGRQPAGRRGGGRHGGPGPGPPGRHPVEDRRPAGHPEGGPDPTWPNWPPPPGSWPRRSPRGLTAPAQVVDLPQVPARTCRSRCPTRRPCRWRPSRPPPMRPPPRRPPRRHAHRPVHVEPGQAGRRQHTDHRPRRPVSPAVLLNRRTRAMRLLLVVVFGVMAFRLVQVQEFGHQHYAALSTGPADPVGLRPGRARRHLRPQRRGAGRDGHPPDGGGRPADHQEPGRGGRRPVAAPRPPGRHPAGQADRAHRLRLPGPPGARRGGRLGRPRWPSTGSTWCPRRNGWSRSGSWPSRWWATSAGTATAPPASSTSTSRPWPARPAPPT